MRSKAYPSFLDEEVLSASPVKLIELLYRGALEAIGSARRYLRQGEIRARSRAISKAMAIVTELLLSLDQEAGGELSRSLAQLYRYVEKLLIEANTEQREAPLITAEHLLATLLEGWQTLSRDEAERPAQPVVVAPEQNYSPPPVSCAYRTSSR